VGAPPTVHMFWHGAPLSRVERLAMASFAAHGHPIHLHAYDEPAGVPAGVVLEDAARVLPRRALFRHPRTGSLAVFADWFRYRLLYERGGLWADADVVCLRPLAFERDEVYAWQDDETVCQAVLGLPAGHEVAAWLVAACEAPNRVRPHDPPSLVVRKLRRRLLGRNGPEWLGFGEVGPRGLTRALRHFRALAAALPTWTFYPLPYREWHRAFDGSLGADSPDLARSSTLHLWHEMMRRSPGFDGNASFPADSLFEELCRRYLPGGGASS
jgi:hypothetical protein